MSTSTVMTSSPFLALLPELVEKVALCLRTTVDVLNLASTNRLFYATLTTAVLYKTQMSEEGWDIEHWEEEARTDPEGPGAYTLGATPTSIFPDRRVQVWQRANHLHRKAQASLDASISDDGRFFLYAAPYDANNPWYPPLCFSSWGTALFDAGEDFMPPAAQWDVAEPELIDGSKAMSWVCGIGPSLLRVVTFHDALNHPRLLDPKYRNTWRTALRMLIATVLHKHLPLGPSSATTQGPNPLEALAKRSAELEQAAVGLCASLFQCDLPALASLADDLKLTVLPALATRYRARSALVFQHQPFSLLRPEHAHRLPDRLSESRRFTHSFVAALRIYLALALNPQATDTVPPPNRALEPTALRAWVRATYGRIASPIPDLPTHGVEHTPLGSMVEGRGYAWAGYYTENEAPRDPPMILTLRRHTSDDQDNVMLNGDGNDSVGPFQLAGHCNRRTGLLAMNKQYIGQHAWSWEGAATPFGLVGRWGHNSGGLWWIWPKEWSDA
ncbi:hypothetical protein OF83DRAFT_450173 [Amylostereum chailletii]|nr:hypothetical protein OF83DRAFT_450173 [Amylostereum chailletii]